MKTFVVHITAPRVATAALPRVLKFRQPLQRVAGLSALAAAGCGGLYMVAHSGLLISGSLPLQPWQVHHHRFSAFVFLEK